MKRPHLTLYGQILLWFFLNLALVAAVLVLVLKVYLRVDPRMVLGGRTHEQFQAVARVLSTELRNAPRSGWADIVARYNEAYGVSFAVYRPGGREALQGDEHPLPVELLEDLRRSHPPRDRGAPEAGPPRQPGVEPEPGDRPPRRPPRDREAEPGTPPPPFPPVGTPALPPAIRPGGPSGPDHEVRVFHVGRSGDPKRYWAAAMVPMANHEHRHPPDAVLVASSPTLGGNEVFYDWRPWSWALVAVLLVSALIWLPFVSRVSRRLRRLTSAAESISDGNFQVEVASNRTDELGRLSRAVQSMANRLDDYMAGQKRFLGDIAHELCSPLARLRMALGVLEARTPEAEHRHLASLSEEAGELAQLVNELLDFSRASIAPEALPAHRIDLAELLRAVAQREGEGAVFEIDSPAGLQVVTNRDLLRRALANVIRNATRYAAAAGPIQLRTTTQGEEVRIEIKDRGPGIPEGWIEKIFEPFSRPEPARTREAGGAGLGLAIARTCVEGLGGRIRATNRPGGGLAVEIAFRSKLQLHEGSPGAP